MESANQSQPNEDSGGLLGSWLGQLSNDVNLLPTDYADWKVFAPHRKDKAWDIILAWYNAKDSILVPPQTQMGEDTQALSL
ncbi:hypothetical protein F2Q69_00035800 [Brassica cretica]|uniref:Uncharacterized protein n=1 Tax=Brassica cretica TaxID=69181 RepID=A0A8S9SVG1_BRACR|nr:hypothetical protein F2Q69_00035800 [Brassica cretica]